MNNEYKGTIVEESLIDKSILKNLDVLKQEESGSWHLYTVSVSEEQIDRMAQNIESNKWYMHFWNDRDVIVVFKDKVFRFNFDKKDTWKPVVDYGLSLGIPREQLDFPIE